MPAQAHAQGLVAPPASVAGGAGLVSIGTHAGTVASGTGAERIVELKKTRLWLRIKNVAARTDEAPVKEGLSLIGEQRQPALAAREGGFDGVDQALRRACPRFQPVDQDPDFIARAWRRQLLFPQSKDAGTDLHPHETLFLEARCPGRNVGLILRAAGKSYDDAAT